MLKPDQRLFEADLLSAEFRGGVVKGLWGTAADDARLADASWPKVYLWVAAAPRANSPERFYLALDAAEYRNAPPTGTFWNAATKKALALTDFPKGKPNSRVAKVFRTDSWATTYSVLYHPYDRVALQGHPDWRMQHPHLVWDSKHTIVDYLNEIRKLLSCEDYIGV
jgi:hypothetical protein